MGVGCSGPTGEKHEGQTGIIQGFESAQDDFFYILHSTCEADGLLQSIGRSADTRSDSLTVRYP